MVEIYITYKLEPWRLAVEGVNALAAVESRGVVVLGG